MQGREPESHRITFAPGVISSILGDREQHAISDKEGYSFVLGDMDLAQAEMARLATFGEGIDHTHPAGYVGFKSAEDRLKAIRAIHDRFPQELGWKWRERLDRSGSDMTTAEWVVAIQNQPIKEDFLKGTSEDPDSQK